MANFSISFNENIGFTFTDLTDYSGLTVTKTDLKIIYPNISSNIEINLDLYNERVSLGGDFEFVVENEELLSELSDGVYRFEFVVLNGETIVESVVKFFINDFSAYKCLLIKTDDILDDECSDQWINLGKLSALLEVAKRRAEEGLYIEAQNIMDYISNKCNAC
jgi:hypothetical protein